MVNKMELKKINDEVYYVTESITKIDRQAINFLKEKAKSNSRQRVRICTHLSMENKLHEMLIVHIKGNAYVRPHKHIEKSESFHIIEGSLNVIVFNNSGEIKEVIQMGEPKKDRHFYYRLGEDSFHTVVPTSAVVVFHETTNGPFEPKDTIFADWSPVLEDIKGQEQYLQSLSLEIDNFINQSNTN